MSETPPPADQAVREVVMVRERPRRWWPRILLIVIFLSLLANVVMIAAVQEYFQGTEAPYEAFYSGDIAAHDKIARLVTDFTIMPPHTERLIKSIKKAREDDAVKGVLLVIDSPGGLVSDSHEIYHELQRLSEEKPVVVSMKGIAASGGYYIAMGAGSEAPIFAQPTTWTGSIGVIVPRYDLSELADKIGVHADSLATGPLKDTLNPLKKMTDEEVAVWDEILQDSFERFLDVIDKGRANLNRAQIEKLATGQVYTAKQALQNGLIDQIGFEDDALAALKQKLELKEARVIEYSHPKSLTESILGVQTPVSQSAKDPVTRLLDASVPRAMYLFGWRANDQ